MNPAGFLAGLRAAGAADVEGVSAPEARAAAVASEDLETMETVGGGAGAPDALTRSWYFLERVQAV